ncbi:MAG TPA: hypothetical protein VM118_13020 [Acidobacteriota bacterium]|nr:hypothetical protein [Acidobacteriota bacterium]
MRIRAYGWALGLAVAGLFLVGCGDDDCVRPHDDMAPAIPQYVYSITADQMIILRWTGSSEPDLAGYKILRSEPNDEYFAVLDVIYVDDYLNSPDELITEWEYVDAPVDNGVYWEYAVLAFDYDGNESEASDIYGRVIDIARPEGFNVRIDSGELLNAFDFSEERKVSGSSIDADIAVVYDMPLDALFVEAANPNYVEIQDFGFTDGLDDLDYAPADGWSGVGWAELIEGHSYVVRRFGESGPNYGKFRVIDMGSRWIRIDWAYQTVPGERQYKRVVTRSTTTLNEEQRRYPKSAAQGSE